MSAGRGQFDWCEDNLTRMCTKDQQFALITPNIQNITHKIWKSDLDQVAKKKMIQKRSIYLPKVCIQEEPTSQLILASCLPSTLYLSLNRLVVRISQLHTNLEERSRLARQKRFERGQSIYLPKVCTQEEPTSTAHSHHNPRLPPVPWVLISVLGCHSTIQW